MASSASSPGPLTPLHSLGDLRRHVNDLPWPMYHGQCGRVAVRPFSAATSLLLKDGLDPPFGGRRFGILLVGFKYASLPELATSGGFMTVKLHRSRRTEKQDDHESLPVDDAVLWRATYAYE